MFCSLEMTIISHDNTTKLQPYCQLLIGCQQVSEEIYCILCLSHRSWMQLRYAQQGSEGPSVVEEKHSWLSNLPECSQVLCYCRTAARSFLGLGSLYVVMAPAQAFLYPEKKTKKLFFHFFFFHFCDFMTCCRKQKACMISVSQPQYYIPLVFSQSRWLRQHAGLSWSL